MRKLLLSLVICIYSLSVFAQITPCPPPAGGFEPPDPEQCLCQTRPNCDGLDVLDNYCLVMEEFATPFANVFPGCAGFTLNNPNWFSFVAGSDLIDLEIIPSECQNMDPSVGSGIQAALYESDNPDLGADCSNCNPDNQGLNAIRTQCSCVEGTILWTGIVTNPGTTYYVVLDGCSGDVCKININVINGGEPPMAGNPGTITAPPAHFVADTVCAGAENYPISLAPVMGAGYYLWTLPNGDRERTTDPELIIPGPMPAGNLTYEVFAANDCDTSELSSSITVFVTPIPEVFETDVVCEGDDYAWDYPISTNVLPGGTVQNFTATRTSDYGCEYTANLALTITDENNENPTVINTAVCEGETYSLMNRTFMPVLENEITEIKGQASTGCDTFFDLTIYNLNAEFDFDPPTQNTTCEDGLITVCPITANISPDPTVVPGLTVTYEWHRQATGLTFEGGECLEIAVDEFLSDLENFDLTVTLNYTGGTEDKECVFGPFSVQLDRRNFIPSDPVFTGPETICLNQSVLQVEYTVTDPMLINQAMAMDFDVDLGALSTVADVYLFPTIGNPIFIIEFTGTGSGDICVTAVGDCVDSDPVCLSVTVEEPPTAEAGTYAPQCDPQLNLSASGTPGEWEVVSQPGSGMVNFSDINDPNAVMTVPSDEKGVYQIAWNAGTEDCSSADTVDIVIGAGPTEVPGSMVTTCNNTADGYTYTFEMEGGTLPYTVVSGNATFDPAGSTTVVSTAEIPEGATDEVVIQDADGCESTITVMSPNCDCTNFPGSMMSDTLKSCNDPLTGIHNNDATLVGINIGLYYLHEASGTILTDIIDQNTTGTFAFDAATMNYEQVYYISYVIGDDIGGGTIDLDGECTKVAAGQPVVWYTTPAAVVDAPLIATCADSIFLEAQAPTIGTGTWSIVSGPAGATISDVNNPTALFRGDCGQYVLSWEVDNEGCSTSATQTVEMNCGPELVQGSIMRDCDPSRTMYDLTFEVMGGEAPYTERDGRITPTGTTFSISGLTAGLVDTFYVLDANGCLLVVPIDIFDCDCTASVTGDMEVCGLSVTLTAEGTGNNGTWSGTTGNPMFSPGVTDREVTITVDSYGTHSFAWNEVCDNSDVDVLYSVTFLDSPSVDVSLIMPVCDGINENYTITFDIEEGDASTYAVGGNSGTLTGNRFVSDPIPSGDSYEFLVTDANGCGEFRIAGDFDCGCKSQVGVLNTDRVNLCTSETIDAASSYDAATQVLDGNDVVVYILHDGSASPFGTILASNTTGEFSFDPAYTPGQVYFISVLVGTESSAGNIDLQDLCLSASNPKEVAWFANPSFDLDATEMVITCAAKSSELSIINISNIGDYSILWTTVDGSIPAGEETKVSPTISAPGTYTATLSHLLAGCQNSESITITASADLPTAAGAANGEITCTNLSVGVSGVGSSSGAGIRYEWTGAGITSDPNMLDITVDQAGPYVLRVVNDNTGCDATFTVNVLEDKSLPTAFATANEKIDCNTTEVSVSAAGSSTGANITYQWTTVNGNIVSGANALDVVVDAQGDYDLLVTNTTNGCTQSASATVLVDDNTISGLDINIDQDVCEQDTTGVIQVLNVIGGQAPYTYSFDNGNSFSSVNFSDERNSGDYRVIVRDANDCEYVDTARVFPSNSFFVELGDTRFVGFGEEVDLFAQTNLAYEDINSIVWSPLNDTLRADSLMQNYVPDYGQTNVRVTLVSEAGCIAQDNVNITVLFSEDVYVPNAFRPTSFISANQHAFIYVNPETVTEISSFAIFDRWGERVFHRENVPPSATLVKEYAWDGMRDNGETSHVGQYTYVAEVVFATGIKKAISGEIMLID